MVCKKIEIQGLFSMKESSFCISRLCIKGNWNALPFGLFGKNSMFWYGRIQKMLTGLANKNWGPVCVKRLQHFTPQLVKLCGANIYLFLKNDSISGLSKVFENTAMFGDLVLRLPDIVHSIYDKNKEWQLLIGWCYWFCKESGVFDGTNGKLLHLVWGNLHFIFIPSPLYHFYLWKMHLDKDLLYSLNQSLQSLFVFIFARSFVMRFVGNTQFTLLVLWRKLVSATVMLKSNGSNIF